MLRHDRRHGRARDNDRDEAAAPTLQDKRPGTKPGDRATVLNMSKTTFTNPVQLDARQSESIGLTLKTDKQMLPTSEGSGRVERLPSRDEIWVRIDYGKKAKIFVKAAPFEGALER